MENTDKEFEEGQGELIESVDVGDKVHGQRSGQKGFDWIGHGQKQFISDDDQIDIVK